MPHPLEELRDAALREIAAAPDEQALEAARVRYLGRSGSISAWGEQMKSLCKEEKPVVGKLLNEVRDAVTAAHRSKRGENLGRRRKTGALAEHRHFAARHAARTRRTPSAHANARSRDRNFSPHGIRSRRRPRRRRRMALLRRAQHRRPIIRRATSRTHFICPMAGLLRTHTSTVQIRTMEAAPPPIRVIAPGRGFSAR